MDTEAPRTTSGEVISSSRRRLIPRPGKKTAIVAVVLFALALFGVAGIAYAGYDYSRQYEGRILPGATVAGVDVGGMSEAEALAEVRSAIAPRLHREVTVSWKDRNWTVTPKQLGASSNARSAVQAAMAASADTSFIEKTRMRVFDEELDFGADVKVRYPRAKVKAFVEGIESRLAREPRDAAIDYSSGWVEIVPERTGRDVNVAKSAKSLRSALAGTDSRVPLEVKTVQPAVTSDAFDQVLLVRIGENKLYLYQDGEITHSYTVATGLPEYPTPTGLWEVTELRYMPTWVNPAPDTWGASLPESIPPGPSNPLGLRAINWSAPAIRFHGTTATYSLGYNASHGCVRMSNEDVIELYDMVEVGTPIVSVEAGPYRPLYTSGGPTSSPTADNSGDSSAGRTG